MEKGKVEIVLADILDELKITVTIMQEQKQQIAQLQERTFAFEERINCLNELALSAINIKPAEVFPDTSLNEIKQLIQQHPQPIIRQWRFLLFPEHYVKEYYTVIFRLIIWMTLVCSVAFLFSLSKQALENSKEVKLRQLENDQYKNAWKYMYDKESKKGQKKMDDAWNRIGKRPVANP